MGDFKRSGGFGGGNRGGDFKRRDGGRPSFGGKPSFNKFGGGGRDDRPKTMFKTICDECKKSCEVPFRPNGDKPVYCSDCFGGKREDNGGGFEKRYENKSFSAPRFPRTEVSTKPAPQNNDLKIQIEALNVKLDKLIDMMKSGVKAKPEVKERTIPAMLKDIENQSKDSKPKAKATKKVVKKVAKKKK